MPREWREWQCPPQAAAENYKIGWLNEHAEDGVAWNKQQRGWADHHKAFDILAGKIDLTKLPDYRSGISTARLKRNIRQVRGAVTNIRPIWGFSSNNPAFAQNAKMMNEVVISIYQEQFLDMSLRAAFDWAAATNTGWIHPVYRRDFTGINHLSGSLQLDTYGQPCILPSQLPSSGDFQKAYAVTLLDELPIYMAHGLFPKFQARLHPTSSKVWYASEIRTAARGNLIQRMFGSWLKPSGGDNAMADAYVPVRKTWVNDLSINETGKTLYMGDWTLDSQKKPVPVNSWSYAVPSLGEKKEDGDVANVLDARIYPYRRLIISSETVIMYDGPAFDWHGQLPLVPLCLDGWAFEPTGFSLVRDGYEIQQSLNELERGVMDKNRAQLDVSLAYDINSTAPKEATQFDPLEPRARVGFDGSVTSTPFTTVVPPEILKVNPEQFQAIQHLEQTMDYQMGVNDVAAMARARGLTNEGAMEEMLEANGPIVADITRSIEWTITMIGTQVKYIIPQYYDVRRIMTYTGPNGVSQMSMDFDPEKLIPSHMPWEKIGEIKDGKAPGSAYSLQQRARVFSDNLRYSVAPHTAHEIQQMAMKLGLIQLRKANVQISSRTIAEAWNISNFGGPDGNTEYERYMAEQEDVAQHAIRVKNIVDAIQMAGVTPTPAMAASAAALGGGQTQEGRPPVGQEAPQINEKDGGTRSTISQTGS